MDIDIPYICYKVTNTVTGKLYIGQTRLTILGRWDKHVQDARRGSPYALHRAIRKYGSGAFTVEEIERVTTLEQVCELERQYISKFNTNSQLGYNMTSGGEGTAGYVFTEEDRKKMAAAQRGKKRGPRTLADKLKISATKKARQQGPSTYCNQRRSETGAGVQRPQETKDKIRAALVGRKRPQEVIDKIRAARRQK